MHSTQLPVRSLAALDCGESSFPRVPVPNHSDEVLVVPAFASSVRCRQYLHVNTTLVILNLLKSGEGVSMGVIENTFQPPYTVQGWHGTVECVQNCKFYRTL